MNKKVILFDFDGVISSHALFGWLKKNVTDFESRSHNFQDVANMADLGEITDEDFFKRISMMTGLSQEEVWEVIFEPVEINKDTLALVQELKKEYTVSLFTNYSSTLLRKLLKKHEIQDVFDQLFISSEIKVKKPDHDAFLRIIKELNVDADDILFIDDNLKNVEAGRKAGIDSVLYENSAQLKQILEEKGFLERDLPKIEPDPEMKSTLAEKDYREKRL